MAEKGQQFQQYALEFKLKMVTFYLEGKGGFRSLAKEHGVRDAQQIRNWVKKYKRGELTQEKSDQRGHCSYTKKIFKDKEEELAYVLLENEYLKKKLLAMGESEIFIANLWSSKNLKQH